MTPCPGGDECHDSGYCLARRTQDERQIESVRKLRDRRFSWVLPGHGRRFHGSPELMPAAVDRCLAWMATA